MEPQATATKTIAQYITWDIRPDNKKTVDKRSEAAKVNNASR